ncbi:MAG: hypothetical protein QW607_10060 [Desulfurococcaceae archaeon]
MIREVVIVSEVIVWLFSFFFFIKHGKNLYESLMLSSFVLGIVDVMVYLLGGNNVLFYIVLTNRVTGRSVYIPVTLTWFLIGKSVVLYLSRDFFPYLLKEVVKGGGEEKKR